MSNLVTYTTFLVGLLGILYIKHINESSKNEEIPEVYRGNGEETSESDGIFYNDDPLIQDTLDNIQNVLDQIDTNDEIDGNISKTDSQDNTDKNSVRFDSDKDLKIELVQPFPELNMEYLDVTSLHDMDIDKENSTDESIQPSSDINVELNNTMNEFDNQNTDIKPIIDPILDSTNELEESIPEIDESIHRESDAESLNNEDSGASNNPIDTIEEYEEHNISYNEADEMTALNNNEPLLTTSEENISIESSDQLNKLNAMPSGNDNLQNHSIDNHLVDNENPQEKLMVEEVLDTLATSGSLDTLDDFDGDQIMDQINALKDLSNLQSIANSTDDNSQQNLNTTEVLDKIDQSDIESTTVTDGGQNLDQIIDQMKRLTALKDLSNIGKLGSFADNKIDRSDAETATVVDRGQNLDQLMDHMKALTSLKELNSLLSADKSTDDNSQQNLNIDEVLDTLKSLGNLGSLVDNKIDQTDTESTTGADSGQNLNQMMDQMKALMALKDLNKLLPTDDTSQQQLNIDDVFGTLKSLGSFGSLLDNNIDQADTESVKVGDGEQNLNQIMDQMKALTSLKDLSNLLPADKSTDSNSQQNLNIADVFDTLKSLGNLDSLFNNKIGESDTESVKLSDGGQSLNQLMDQLKDLSNLLPADKSQENLNIADVFDTLKSLESLGTLVDNKIGESDTESVKVGDGGQSLNQLMDQMKVLTSLKDLSNLLPADKSTDSNSQQNLNIADAFDTLKSLGSLGSLVDNKIGGSDSESVEVGGLNLNQLMDQMKSLTDLSSMFPANTMDDNSQQNLNIADISNTLNSLGNFASLSGDKSNIDSAAAIDGQDLNQIMDRMSQLNKLTDLSGLLSNVVKTYDIPQHETTSSVKEGQKSNSFDSLKDQIEKLNKAQQLKINDDDGYITIDTFDVIHTKDYSVDYLDLTNLFESSAPARKAASSKQRPHGQKQSSITNALPNVAMLQEKLKSLDNSQLNVEEQASLSKLSNVLQTLNVIMTQKDALGIDTSKMVVDQSDLNQFDDMVKVLNTALDDKTQT